MSAPKPFEPVPDMAALIIMHGRQWRIITPERYYQVMDDNGNLTGPFMSLKQAWHYIEKRGAA